MIDDAEAIFAGIRAYDWDPPKREAILREREIDFEDVRTVFDGPTIVRRSDRKGEKRYMVFGFLYEIMVFGFLYEIEVVIVCTIRDEVCRIISARRARRDERKDYHAHLSRLSAPERKE